VVAQTARFALLDKRPLDKTEAAHLTMCGFDEGSIDEPAQTDSLRHCFRYAPN
jgi:hypothetical protein